MWHSPQVPWTLLPTGLSAAEQVLVASLAEYASDVLPKVACKTKAGQAMREQQGQTLFN